MPRQRSCSAWLLRAPVQSRRDGGAERVGDRAIQEFRGWIEVFCHCEPSVAEQRMRTRATMGIRFIAKLINPALLQEATSVAAFVTPLSLGSGLIKLDTTEYLDATATVAAVRAAVNRVPT